MPRPDLDAIWQRWKWIVRPTTVNMDAMQRAIVDIDALLTHIKELEAKQQ